MILSGTFTTRCAREFATRQCQPGIEPSAIRTSGKSQHFCHEYKSCHRECRTTGRNHLEWVQWLRVRKRTKISSHRRPTSELGYNKSLRAVRDFPPGPRGRNLCLLISLCPRWASLFLRGLLQSG